MIAQDMAMIVTERTKMGIEEISIPREIEADGFITRKQDMKPLERATDTTASSTSECCYPRCEECSKYADFGGARYCTVPMVVNKQAWKIGESKFYYLEARLNNLQDMLFAHLYSDESPKGAKEDDERELYDKTIMDLAGEQR